MSRIFRSLLIFTTLCVFFVSAHAQYDGKHEWRAVWIATVGNMDWPSSQDLTSEQQKAELIAYLDLYKSLNFNAIVFQVRPTADAFYASKLEPWSHYLTGQQGKAPNPYYDPLAFIIEESHKRGMELHAWLNPYRITYSNGQLENLASSHIYNTHPEWFTQHGRRVYFDPALPQTRDFTCKVAADIVRRYDVDGIHMDDYFYPDNNFEDSLSFVRYNRGYAPEDKMAWRRENVDLVIQQLRDTIKSIKPYVKFGISPYAVWRNLRDDPRGSDTQSYAYTNYDHLHADVLKWMENRWVDYMLPQLYFHIGYERADFTILAKWWGDYSDGLPLYAGLGSFKLSARADEPWNSVAEVVKQIEHIRRLPEYSGVCYFNAKNFTDNRLNVTETVREIYTHPTLVPPLRGFDTKAPQAPQQVVLTRKGENIELKWQAPAFLPREGLPAMYYAVYRFRAGETPDFAKGDAIVWLGGDTQCSLPVEGANAYRYYVTALDRLFNEGPASEAR